MKSTVFLYGFLVCLCCADAVAVPHRWTPTYGSPFGINIHTVIWDGNAKAVAAIKDAGIGWVRVDFNWLNMEPQKGKYNWQVSDGIVNVAVKNQFNVFATLAYSPNWAAAYQAPAGKQSGPKNAKDYEDFVEAVVKRYRGKVSHWGIWNEPNLDHFLWFPGGIDVKQKRAFYINNIVLPGIRAVRRADPDAVIVIGDMAHLGQSLIPAKDHSWQPWLEELLKSAGSQFDVISHHTYQDDYMRTINGSTWPWEYPSLWATIQKYKLTKKPMWLTEIGWRTDEISEAQQAANYKQMFDTMLGLTQAKGQLWWARVFPYELIDDPNIKEKWGIVKADWSRKAAWTAYRDYIKSHQPVPRIKAPTTAKTGQTITLDGSGSTDPDGSILRYSWDLDASDGVKEDQSGKIISHSFTKPGTYKVTLTVTDNHDIAIGTQVEIQVSQGSTTPPQEPPPSRESNREVTAPEPAPPREPPGNDNAISTEPPAPDATGNPDATAEPGTLPDTTQPQPDNPGTEPATTDMSTGNDKASGTGTDDPSGTQGGCGCQAAESGLPWWMLALVLLVMLRKRKDPQMSQMTEPL